MTLDEVNQQMTSRFDSDGLSFMRQLSFFMPSSLMSSYHVSTDDIQSMCAQYRGVPVELFVTGTGTGIFGENFAGTDTGIFRATCVVFFCTSVNQYSSRSLKVPARAAKCSLTYSPL